MDYLSLLLTILSTLTIISLSFYIYNYSSRNDKLWFYTYTTVLVILVQWMSDLGSSLIFGGYYLHLASVVLFPSVLLGFFLTYTIHGTTNARQMLNLLIAGEVGYVIAIGLLILLGNTPSYITPNILWLQNHFFSTLALIIDYIILFFLWPIFHNPKIKLPFPFKICCTFLLLLMTDSLVFTLGTFWNNPALFAIIKANLVIRFILTLLTAPLISHFLNHLLKNSDRQLNYRSWSEIISNQSLNQELFASQKKIDELTKLKAELDQKNLELDKQRRAILNVLEDVTSEKKLSEKHAQDLLKFQLAAENVNDHIVITDPDGLIIYANKAVTNITGFSKEEILGKKAGSPELWGGQMPDSVYVQFWNTIKNQKTPFSGEFVNVRKNGEKYNAEAQVSPILDNNGNVIFFVGIERDITHAKEVDRMKTEFISLASHQLRTPLSAMKWFLEMLQNGDFGKLKKEQQEAIDNIEISNERMISLVNGLLNISRIESGRIIVEPKSTDIKKLTNSILKDIENKARTKHQKIIISANPNLPLISLDPELIGQVILNFLTNAIKYTPEKGEITIFISKDSQSLIFQVSDNGYGIPETEQGKVFERFFRATNITNLAVDGTGLGLYLAKAIITSSGGQIWFTSKVGEGSSFYFKLPLIGMQPKQGEVRLS